LWKIFVSACHKILLFKDTRSGLTFYTQNVRPDPEALLNYNNYSSKNRAYRIQAWRLGEYEGSISGNLNGYFNYSVKVYTLDLTGKTYRKIKLEGERSGTLRVSCIRKDMENFNDYGDWEITVIPINGGIQKTTDLYMNIAPASGYQTSINVVMHKDASGYVPHLRNKDIMGSGLTFYVKCKA
jgi:hypothetical protein